MSSHGCFGRHGHNICAPFYLEIMQQSTFVQFGIDITQACLINFIVLSISDMYIGRNPLQVVSVLGIDLNISISQVMVGD